MIVSVRKRTDGKVELKNTANENAKAIVLTQEQVLTLAKALFAALDK